MQDVKNAKMQECRREGRRFPVLPIFLLTNNSFSAS